MNKIDPKRLAGYDEDLALWSAEQAALIRTGSFDRVDLENAAEEIESLGISIRHEIGSRLEVLLIHLLKWERQPEHRSRSWSSTIRGQREAILDLLEESPSLRPYPATQIAKRYSRAREKAAEETTVLLKNFPESCPYTIEQILDPDFLPGEL
ncbi:MAG: DUF29 domain-containing protein [Devosia sp.]